MTGRDGFTAPAERRAYIALGANLGDREASLREALRRLHARDGISIDRVSAVYETDPVGYVDQPRFLNMAAALTTRRQPPDLLREMLEVERELGRVRNIRFGPRTIDLDLLLMDGVELSTEELTLPHPRMMERAFVLVPLLEVLDEHSPFRPAVESAAREALSQGKDGIVRWTTITWPCASAHFEN
jgi:2-amino-4-hydroxy-6-hydroxymethyldihydropteridine pyrophosphokinase